jgi:hypothetical protein
MEVQLNIDLHVTCTGTGEQLPSAARTRGFKHQPMPEPSDDSTEKQCRICLDGLAAEGELGRLIRPCLCKGSISVSSKPRINVLMLTSVDIVRAYQVSSDVENDSCIQQCLLLVPAMPLQVPVHSHSSRRNCHQSRHVLIRSVRL